LHLLQEVPTSTIKMISAHLSLRKAYERQSKEENLER